MTADHSTQTKRCNKCNAVKPVAEFYRNRGGIHARCKICTNEAEKARRLARVVHAWDSQPTEFSGEFTPVTQVLDAQGRDWAWAFVVFRPIPGFPGYLAGSDGSLWSSIGRGAKATRTFRPWTRLIPHPNHRGALQVSLYRDGKQHLRFVHRLVLESFIGLCPEGMEACHGPDNDPANCRLGNLRWDTHVSNMADKHEHGTAQIGERGSKAILSNADVLEIRRLASEKVGRASLAERFGVSKHTVNKIVQRTTWRHL